jgi:hypothetical protein
LEFAGPLSHQQFIFQHSTVFCRAEQVNVALELLGFCHGNGADRRKWGAMTGLSWLTVRSFGSFERGNEPPGFRKLGEFHDLLSNC